MLIGHWPLNGDLNDYSGNNNHLTYENNNGKIVDESLGKIGAAKKRAILNDGTDWLGSTENYDLQGDFTFAIWAKVTDVHSGTANGILTNHNHANNSGAGITIKEVSSTDYRISCNTGTGSSRTYHTYFGTSNIKDRWAHLVLRFIKETDNLSLWVDGEKEYEGTYSQFNISQKIGLFSWSLGHNTNTSYRPASILNDARVYDHALSAYEIKELAKAKLLHYKFNEIDDNEDKIIDISGYKIHSSNYGGIFQNDSPIGSGSYNFSSGAYIESDSDISFLPSYEGFSFSYWVKYTSFTNDWAYTIHMNEWGSNIGSSAFWGGLNTTNKIVATISGKDVGYAAGTTTVTPNLDEWYHVVSSWDGAVVRVYVNNIEEKSYNLSSPTAQTSVIRCGSYLSNLRPINGNIADVRIYSFGLTEDNVESLYRLRANLDNTGNISASEIVSHEASFSRDGLILELDPANRECFKEGDTTCVNLVSGGLVTGASGTPYSGTHTPNPNNFPSLSYNNRGTFDFGTGKGMNVEEDLGSHTSFTFSLWFYRNGSYTNGYFSDARNDGGQWFLSNYISYNINYTNTLTYNYGGSYDAANTDFVNVWTHLVIVSDSSGSKLYLDGELITTANSLSENLGKNFRIGTRFTTSVQWQGEMGPILIYNRVLTDTEIEDIYNAQKDRFVNPSINKKFNIKGQALFTDIDEITGTQNTNALIEINKNGALLLNGEFSEVD
jgi:hypothetical protein